MRNTILFWLPSVLLMVTLSCQDFVQIDPPKNELSTPTVFATDAVAESAVRGIYTAMGSQTSFAGGFGSTLSALQGIASDELVNITPQFMNHYENSLTPTDASVKSNWASLYYVIYLSNATIAGIERSRTLSSDVSAFLIGEAKFIRALCCFYLANLWGDAPLIVSEDYRLNSSPPRAPLADLYDQIVRDLTDAKQVLPANYSRSGGLRTRASKWAAAALLSRTYLYLGEWSLAEVEATSIIENVELFRLESDLNDVFRVTSLEAILQFYPIGSGINNSKEGRLFLPTDALLAAGVPPLYPLTDYLLSAFEANDDRRVSWVANVELNNVVYHHPYKYKIYSSEEQIEFTTLLRLAEQYLIRAESRAHLGNITGPNSAESDLNTIRNRAGLDNTSADNEVSMMDAVIHERRVELFSEWGHRWFDLVRTGRANAVLGAIKSDWSPEDMLRPIPQSELNLNPFLFQNPGY